MKKVLYVIPVSRTINAFLIPKIEMLLENGYEVHSACSIDKPDNILNTVPVLDSLVFISTLFILSSVLEKSGVLDSIVKYIISFTSDNVFLILLAVLFSAFIIATFLSAGPAAATLLPICLQLNPIVGSNLVYAALVLGILAGSSMLPWSATGGPIMLIEVGRYQNDHIIESN